MEERIKRVLTELMEWEQQDLVSLLADMMRGQNGEAVLKECEDSIEW